MSKINIVTTDELRGMRGSEGLILQGCGGDLTEWVDGINEMLVAETTCMNSASSASFDDACLAASRKLDSGDFVLFLDIYRARIGQIRPLPMRVAGSGGWTLIEDKKTEAQEKAKQDFLKTLNRIPSEPNEYMLAGIEFEKQCYEGNTCISPIIILNIYINIIHNIITYIFIT